MLFCKPLRNKSRFKPFRVIDGSFTFTEYEKAALVSKKDWSQVVTSHDLFLDLDYLSIIEKATNVSLKCRYVIIYKDQQPCAVMYFQLTDFRADVFGELLEGEVQQVQSKRLKLFEKYIQTRNENEVLMRLLTCGNNLISGEYGYKKNDLITDDLFYKVFCTLIKTMASEDNLRGKISAILVKDFYRAVPQIDNSESFKGNAFSVEPNMFAEIPDGVTDLEGYIQMFSKKYRNRAKGILKNRSSFEIRELTLDDIVKFNDDIYQLYLNIFDRAKFKLLQLPTTYFIDTKRIFNEQFFVRAIFYQGKIVAFSSGFFMHNKTVEAHYIGLNYKVNEELELYQNILYDFIEQAIGRNFVTVNLGRTAAEIKTTIGAKAHDLICYLQAQNTISKLIVKPFIEFLKPKHWTPRNPFKEADQINSASNN